MTTRIADFSQHVGQDITLRGWVYNVRSSGKIAFLQMRDGSGWSQAIVAQQDVDTATWDVATQVTIESSVEITGTVSKHPKKEEYELQVRTLTVMQRAAEYPISKKEHGPDFLLNQRHLWLRSPRQWALQRIRNGIFLAITEHLRAEGYIRIDTPILTPTSCEDTTELFEMDYFDEGKAYLTQSGQLYLEAAAFSHGRVYDFGPVFRAEKSKTRRHLTEFWMLDVETLFADYVDNMDVQEKLVQAIIRSVLAQHQKELAILERDPSALEKCLRPFVRITHEEAVKQLQALGKDAQFDGDLGADDETVLTQQYDTPIFVTKYPANVKAFYMEPDPADPTRALCSDLLAPEGYGEVIGGSQRIADYDKLVARMEEYHLPRTPFEWYLDLRKYGSAPHAGFGLGLERTVAWISGIQHIRETIPFPRMINRLNP